MEGSLYISSPAASHYLPLGWRPFPHYLFPLKLLLGPQKFSQNWWASSYFFKGFKNPKLPFSPAIPFWRLGHSLLNQIKPSRPVSRRLYYPLLVGLSWLHYFPFICSLHLEIFSSKFALFIMLIASSSERFSNPTSSAFRNLRAVIRKL